MACNKQSRGKNFARAQSAQGWPSGQLLTTFLFLSLSYALTESTHQMAMLCGAFPNQIRLNGER